MSKELKSSSELSLTDSPSRLQSRNIVRDNAVASDKSEAKTKLKALEYKVRKLDEKINKITDANPVFKALEKKGKENNLSDETAKSLLYALMERDNTQGVIAAHCRINDIAAKSRSIQGTTDQTASSTSKSEIEEA